MNAAQQLTSALRGSTHPSLVKSGIDHLRSLTEIFNATKEGYDGREETQATKTTVHYPRVPRGSPPPRVTKEKKSHIAAIQIPQTIMTRETLQREIHVPKAPV